MEIKGYATLGGAQDLVAQVDRILSGGLSGKSVLDERFGPTHQCFSVRDIVNLFQWGASIEDTLHLSACLSCREWVAKYAERPSHAGAGKIAAESVTKHWFKGFASLFGGTPEPKSQPALLHVRNGAMSLDDLAQPQEFVIVGGISGKIEPHSLRLNGALVADGGSVITTNNCEYPVIRFERVKLADRLRESLQKHVALTDSIFVQGRLAGGSKQPFSGKARVRLVRDAKFKTAGE